MKISRCTELDWWEEREIELTPVEGDKGTSEPPAAPPIKAVIECLPCQHASNRGVTDRNSTLWASWGIKSGGKNMYFAG